MYSLILLWHSHVQFVLFVPKTCNPIKQLQGRKCTSTVALDNSASLHGPSEACRVKISELWTDTTLNVTLVHFAGTFLFSWPSARPLSEKWRNAWMVALTGWPA